MGYSTCYYGQCDGIEYLGLFKFETKETVLVITGTNQILDWKYNLRIVPNKHGVHKGFFQAYKSIEHDIRDIMIRLFVRFGRSEKLIVTGHSLGGAVAQLLGRFQDADEVVTFGSPKVFTRWKKVDNGQRVTHVKIKGDVVPKLPLFLYNHKGDELVLQSKANGGVLRKHSMLTYLNTIQRHEEGLYNGQRTEQTKDT